VVTAADEDSVIAVAVVPGQAHDAPQLEPLLRETLARVPVVDELVGDKGFDSDDLRRACLDRDVMPQIPCRANRTDPVEVYPDAYRTRNRIERLFNKAKQFRRVATRYDKLKGVFLGVLHLVFGFLRLRKLANVNRT